MKKMTYISISISIAVILSISFLFLMNSCQSEDSGKKTAEERDTVNVLVDEAIAPMMEEPFRMYREDKPEVELIAKTVDAWEAMRQLLSGNTDAVVLARDYLKTEDSLMKEFEVKKHVRNRFAQDALVFFAPKNFPLDTLNTEIVKKLLTEKDTELKDLLPQLEKEPEFVINDNYSSEFANLLMFAADYKPIVKPMKKFSTPDSVIEYVRESSNAVGIGLLSQVVNDGFFKPLRMGYIDSAGAYVKASKPVHQAYIVMGQYPYIADEYVYLFKDMRNTAYWFSEFITKEKIVVEYYKKYGIAPTYAKYNLIKKD